MSRNINLLRFIVGTLLISCSCASNKVNYFENFICDNPQNTGSVTNCKVTGITSKSLLETIFNNLNSLEFRIYVCTYNCYYDSNFRMSRKDLTEYTVLTFEKSQFEKFPSGTFSKLSQIKTMIASDVGLTEINRDDFKSFKALKVLDLSMNKIKNLGNVVLLHLESLEKLDLKNNLIETIHVSAFDECSKGLKFVYLENNKLKQIHQTMIDAIGHSEESMLILDFNEIEEIIPPTTDINSPRQFKLLSFSDNKLKSFNYNCSKIKSLYLDSNQLEDFTMGNCTVSFLNATKNPLTTVNLLATSVSELMISDNDKLSNLKFNVENLTKLEIRNIPSGLVTFDLMKNATNLVSFDATNTFLGTNSIDTFSEMEQLTELKLSNTGLSHIDYGMFSHQKNVMTFDISYNNLKSIDIKMLTSMKLLDTFDISGNNLSSFEHVNEINKIFPNLTEIGIADNNWNCSYLASLYKLFEENSILITQPSNIVKNSSNVMGIGCMTSSQLKIKPVDDDKANDALAKKLNEIIEIINAEKTRNNNMKYDNDIVRAELFHIQKDLLDLKTKAAKDQFVMNMNSTNNNNVADFTAVRNMMEQLNNLTLEKQKLAIDQLQLKIDQLNIQITKKDLENQDYVKKSQLHLLLADNQKVTPIKYEYIKHEEDHKDENKATHVLLTIVITSLLVVGIVYGYLKLKNLFYRQNDLYSVRARSTNTINTTVEIPEHHI
ncbi:protein artichoke-like [Chironomus tepperi]|uniref:protein artichoke-like n=1 Tax=Chironomus tepperi TaxID=113505 RepID=UPI00391F627F